MQVKNRVFFLSELEFCDHLLLFQANFGGSAGVQEYAPLPPTALRWCEVSHLLLFLANFGGAVLTKLSTRRDDSRGHAEALF